MVDLAVRVFDGRPRKIGCLSFKTRDGIEERTLPTVWLANKNNVRVIIQFRQRSQP